MKKILLTLICALAFFPFIKAQKVIEDFELLTINELSDMPYTSDSLYIVDNPAPNNVNNSTRVLKMVRSKTGDPWAGFWCEPPSPIDLTDYKYVTANIMKPRVTVVKFKVEQGTTTPAQFELASTNPQTKTNEWEKLTFHFPDATGTYKRFAMLVDFMDPVGLSNDINVYIDDIVLRKQPIGGDTIVLDDFQAIPLNQLSNSDYPADSLKIVKNPVKDDVNPSDKVLKFIRSKDGDPFAGFWSTLPVPIDMTDNKYVLLKVLKPRISTVKFKIEGGTTTPDKFELESVDPQTVTDAWQQLVFYFPDATGTYPTIAVEPDFMDPVGLDQDAVMYIDDIVSSPTASMPTGVKDPQKLNVSIFPNPVKSTLYFGNLKNIDRIVLSNLVGQQLIVNRNIVGESTSMNVSSLSNGIYMVTVYDKSGNASIMKIVKQ